MPKSHLGMGSMSQKGTLDKNSGNLSEVQTLVNIVH